MELQSDLAVENFGWGFVPFLDLLLDHGQDLYQVIGCGPVERIRTHVLEPKDAFFVDDEGGGNDFRSLVGRFLDLELGGYGPIRVGKYGKGEVFPSDFRSGDEIPGLREIFGIDEKKFRVEFRDAVVVGLQLPQLP